MCREIANLKTTTSYTPARESNSSPRPLLVGTSIINNADDESKLKIMQVFCLRGVLPKFIYINISRADNACNINII